MRLTRGLRVTFFLVVGLSLPVFSAGQKIGLSYGEITSYLSNVITLKPSTPVDGQSRSMGLSADNLAMLEVIGDRANITQATLMIGVPNDSRATLIRNSALMIRFVKNATPNWPGSVDWAATALDKASKTGRSVETTSGIRRITVTFHKPLGMILVTVKHK